MSAATRLTEVMQSAPVIPFDNTSKFIFFSDCHRGDNSWADDFADNQNLFFHALAYYNRNNYTYIEVGDGDELWENEQFKDIRSEHDDVFWLMNEFHKDKRLYLIWGNHDNERKDPEKVKSTLQAPYFDVRSGNFEYPFQGIRVHEGLVLNYLPAEGKGQILVVHGHQGDSPNDDGCWLTRLLVRHLWRHLQLLGVHDPTSPANSKKKGDRVAAQLEAWANANHPLIAGHTHCSSFPQEGAPPYFNDGSCVHPRCITGIEIQNGEIQLIKWSISPKCDPSPGIRDDVLLLTASREGLEKARSLKDVFSECRAERERVHSRQNHGQGIQSSRLAAVAVALGALFWIALLGKVVNQRGKFKLE